MNIDALMTPEPQACTSENTLREAAKKMWDHSYGCLPVVDDDGRVVGMLTDRDICLAAYIQEDTLDALHVGSAMTPDPHTLRGSQSVAEAMEAMRGYHVRRLPVVDEEGVLTGLLSLDDIAREAVAGGKGIDGDEVARTFAAVSLRAARISRDAS